MEKGKSPSPKVGGQRGIILYQSKYGVTKKYAPWQKALMSAVRQSCDWTDRKYIEPILREVKPTEEL